MNEKTRTRGAAALLLLASVAAAAPAPCASLYVLNERAESISVVNLSLGAVVATINLADPDGDLLPDPPADLTFSTLPGNMGDHAYVTQGRFLRVVDLRTRTVVRTHDIAALLGLGSLTLAGCEAAPPRLHIDPASGMPVIRAYLHVSANLAGGAARFVVFDQQKLFLPTPGPPAGSGLLAANASAMGVKALEEPLGPMFQRAWYQTSSSSGGSHFVSSVLVQSGQTLGSPWSVAKQRTFRVPAAPFGPVRMGAPAGGGELPVLPTAGTGSLENLDTGDGCPLSGELTAVSVTGAGLSSYTILAARNDTSELVVVNGKDCSTESFPTGAGPVDVATLGPIDWVEAFTANRDGDSVTRLRRDGSLQTILIGSGGGTCVACPIALGIAPPTQCAPTNLRVDVRDADGDSVRDDLHLQWSAPACAPGTEFFVYCTCTDDAPNCPCACDCSALIPPPECQCPGILSVVPFVAGSFQLEPDVQIQENPWKILGVTGGTSFDAADVGDDPDGMLLNVTTGESP